MLIPYATDKTDNFIGYGAVGIMVACLFGFLVSWPAETAFEKRLVQDSIPSWTRPTHPATLDSLAEAGGPVAGEEEGAPPQQVPAIPKELTNFVPGREAKPSTEIQARIQTLLERESPMYRFGFHPASGRWVPGIVVYQFLHAGWFHLLGNLVFFFAFGVALEKRYGLWGFLAFYLVGGAFAALAHVGAYAGIHLGRLPAATLVGASGSIAAVMGAYLRSYPSSKVKVFVWLFRPRLGQIPAWVFLGAWFLMEFVRSQFLGDKEGGTAYMAHVGGFLFGFLLAPLVPVTDEIREEEREARRPKGQGVAFSFPERPATLVVAPPPPPAGKIPMELGDLALAQGDEATAAAKYAEQFRIWVRGTAFDLDELSVLVLRLDRDHPALALDPLVQWETGIRLAADPRLSEAARICLLGASRDPDRLPPSMLQRCRDVLGTLEVAKSLPPGFDPPPPAFLAPPARPGSSAGAPPAPRAPEGTGWLTD